MFLPLSRSGRRANTPDGIAKNRRRAHLSRVKGEEKVASPAPGASWTRPDAYVAALARKRSYRRARGGRPRDLLIGAPVFWVHANATLLICIGAAIAVWLLSSRRIAARALDWFDAAGLAAYATYGSAKALGYGVAPVPAFAMGVLTACFGGIVRDVLAGEPSILMRPELYVTAAALAAGLFVGLSHLGAPMWLAAAVGTVAGFGLRRTA